MCTIYWFLTRPTTVTPNPPSQFPSQTQSQNKSDFPHSTWRSKWNSKWNRPLKSKLLITFVDKSKWKPTRRPDECKTFVFWGLVWGLFCFAESLEFYDWFNKQFNQWLIPRELHPKLHTLFSFCSFCVHPQKASFKRWTGIQDDYSSNPIRLTPPLETNVCGIFIFFYCKSKVSKSILFISTDFRFL